MLSKKANLQPVSWSEHLFQLDGHNILFRSLSSNHQHIDEVQKHDGSFCPEESKPDFQSIISTALPTNTMLVSKVLHKIKRASQKEETQTR